MWLFERSAAETTAAAASIADPEQVAAGRTPDLAAGITGMIAAKIAYTANARVLEAGRDQDRVLLDLLA